MSQGGKLNFLYLFHFRHARSVTFALEELQKASASNTNIMPVSHSVDSEFELRRMGLAGPPGPNEPGIIDEAAPPLSSTLMVCVKKEALAGCGSGGSARVPHAQTHAGRDALGRGRDSSPALVVSKVTRVDDHVASLDLMDEGGGVGVREKRRFRDAFDVEGGEAAGQGLRGQGGAAEGQKLKKKRQKEAKNKQGDLEDKRKEEAVEKIQKRPSSEDSNEVHKQDQGEEVGSSRAKGEAVKRKRNRSLTEEAGTAGKAQRGEGVGGVKEPVIVDEAES